MFYGIFSQPTTEPPEAGEMVYISDPDTPAQRKAWARRSDGTTRELHHIDTVTAGGEGFTIKGKKSITIYPNPTWEAECDWVEGRPGDDYYQGVVREQEKT